jgi:hypothetical protein
MKLLGRGHCCWLAPNGCAVSISGAAPSVSLSYGRYWCLARRCLPAIFISRCSGGRDSCAAPACPGPCLPARILRYDNGVVSVEIFIPRQN